MITTVQVYLYVKNIARKGDLEQIMSALKNDIDVISKSFRNVDKLSCVIACSGWILTLD